MLISTSTGVQMHLVVQVPVLVQVPVPAQP
jgi:hypothetical protein